MAMNKDRFVANRKLALRFALFGPPIGGVLFSAVVSLSHSPSTGLPQTAFIFTLLLSYLLGVVPAYATGFLLGFWYPTTLRKAMTLAAGIGFCLSLLFFYAIDHSDHSALLIAIPGACASAILGFFNYRRAATTTAP